MKESEHDRESDKRPAHARPAAGRFRRERGRRKDVDVSSDKTVNVFVKGMLSIKTL